MEKQGVVAIDDVGITPMMALRTRFTPIQWLVCLVAAIEFFFDIYEVVILQREKVLPPTSEAE